MRTSKRSLVDWATSPAGRQVLITLILSILATPSSASDILGCGGFVRSPYKLDFDKIEIKLFTKQGSLKLKTECAPTTGYYFIPLESKGDYVVKISPPDGWTFEPSEVAIQFDGKTDSCSKGEDVNFDFKGFAVQGKVVSAGFSEGPAGVTLSLTGPENLKLTAVTGTGGSFMFDSIPPGSYIVRASQDTLKFDKADYKFEISNKNAVVQNQLIVSGYDLKGKVSSDGNPVEAVTILLVSEDPKVKNPTSCKADKIEGISLPSDLKGKVLCVKNSDKKGVFHFSGISPGQYTVVPVYRGANMVYNVNPDRMAVEVGHSSMELTTAFEVEGFTVQGKVRGHAGASVLVNGEVRATSGHDGAFTIAKMKPGVYEFEVMAEKFQFDKKRITIQPTNPVIPDFIPSKFQICGSITTSSSVGSAQLTLAFSKTGAGQNQVIRETISDPVNSCVYLPEGKYTVQVESVPEKYFLPEKSQISVPATGTGFAFKEFTGSIGGSVTCQFASCDGIKIRVENSQSGTLIQEKLLINGERKFKFENLESGLFKLVIIGEKFCWNKEFIDNVQLKNANVENLSFIQTGVPLEIESTHSTTVEISGKSKASNKQLKLEANKVEKICLTDPDSPPESYQIVPVGCTEFDRTSYPLKIGQRIQLVARKHRHSWNILSSKEILDLKITRNGESYTIDEVANNKEKHFQISKSVEGKDKIINYEIASLEEPGSTVEWQAFSYGFIFEPNTFTIDALNSCQDNLFQVVAKQSHVIKGKFVPPLEGVDIKIDLIGDPDSTIYVTSNNLGEYIAGPFVHPSGFKATPELAGYIFKPLENDPFSFTVSQLPKIQVKIQTGSENIPVPSVLLSLSGPNSYRQNKITNDNGEMTFGDLHPGQYYLKALLKEFQFQPSSINIDLKEQETKTIILQAIRESFSLYGQLSSLSGELMPNLLVAAKGVGNCSEYGEEGSSDEMGNFRIWALKSYCDYQISVVKKDEFANSVERTIPEVLNVKMGAEDVHNVSFVVITPVRRMDVSLRVITNNEKSLDHLKAVVYSSRTPDSPLHVVPFNGVSYVILPPIPKDGNEYTVSFEATLNKHQYNYRLPAEINFNADSAYAHYRVDFNIEPAPVDQEIGKNSYIAFAMICLVVLIIVNHERVGNWAKDTIENYTSNNTAALAAKKSKSKTK